MRDTTTPNAEAAGKYLVQLAAHLMGALVNQ